MSGRGDVVVRVRRIAEDRAAAHAAVANHASLQARRAADLARERAAQHPLSAQGNQEMRGDAIMAALGMAAALRESVTIADAHITRTDADVEVARKAMEIARSQRKAAERIADRRREAWEAENARRDQRTLDESALATRSYR